FGVPESAELVFTRDDVSARIRVNASSAPMQIELNGNAASVGRRRAAPTTPLLQIEGRITAVSATEITIHDSHDQDVTAKVTNDTIIRKGDQTLQAADLHVGDRVHVQATVSGDIRIAMTIILQNPDDNGDAAAGQTTTANGAVTATRAS